MEITAIKMNYYQANNLLDEVREGAKYPLQLINKALELTGDANEFGIPERFRSEGMEDSIQEKSK
jgi:hypothetical protein